MALEDLTGTNKYIANLVNTNPLSADDRREGDDHIRGIKNVLLNTFGALSGPVDLGLYVKKAGDTMTGPLTVTGDIAATASVAGVGGSTAAPAFKFGNEATTGLYRKAAGVIGVAIGGAEKVNFAANGLTLINGANVMSLWMAAGAANYLNMAAGAGATAWAWQWDAVGGGTLRWLGNTSNGLVEFTPAGAANKSSGAGSWGAISDARIKDRVVDYTTGLAAILALRPRWFFYRPGMERDEDRHAGMIAQEVEEVMPDTVTVGPGKLGEHEWPDLRTFDPTNITYALVNAVKTLAARVEALEVLCAGVPDA